MTQHHVAIESAAKQLHAKSHEEPWEAVPVIERVQVLRGLELTVNAYQTAMTIDTSKAGSDDLPVGTVGVDEDGALWTKDPRGWFVICHEDGVAPWLEGPCEGPSVRKFQILRLPKE